jgi:hypothetical protein
MGSALSFAVVRLRRVQNRKGESETISVLPMEYTDLLTDKKITDEILPKIEIAYANLVKQIKDGKDVRMAIDEFFQQIPDRICVGNLGSCLVEDLNLKPAEVWTAMTKTCWAQELISLIKREFRKRKKDDPIKYCEAVLKLVENFGLNGTKILLHNNGINTGTSTLEALCKVAMDSPKVKRLIRQGKIGLTDMFWIKGDRVEREKKALALANTKGGKR